MQETIKLKGRLQQAVDVLIKNGIYKNKEEIARDGIRKIAEEYGLLPSAKYHFRELQLMSKKKNVKDVMEKLEKVSDDVWEKEKNEYKNIA